MSNQADDHDDDDFLGAPPAPRAAFRARLRRNLLADGPPSARPPGLRARVAAFAGAGFVLLAIGALSVAGAGPLAS
jgi:hypothetical protein